MKFKLDENFGMRTQHIFREAGHDVHTVYQEGLQDLAILERLIRQLLLALDNMSVEKRLWIVEMGRIRVHQSDIEYG